MIQIDDRADTERGLAELNRLGEENLTAELLRLCGSMRWAQTVAHAAPFHDKASLIQVMDKVWWSLDPADWLEAFAVHPRIGDKEGLRKKFEAAAAAASGGRGGDHGSGASGGGEKPWEAEEQSGASGASEETLNALQQWNGRYEDKYGHIFLVCATGKTADEMLRLLKERMANDNDSELRVAAGEQSKITHLRLQKLLQALSHDGAEHDGSSRL